MYNYDMYQNYQNVNDTFDTEKEFTAQEDTTDVKVALSRGNMFSNLYWPYKIDYSEPLKGKNEKENLMIKIQELGFYCLEANLFLDIFPEDKEMLEKFNTYSKLKDEYVKEYENKYGEITLVNGSNTWNWINEPWPWQKED